MVLSYQHDEKPKRPAAHTACNKFILELVRNAQTFLEHPDAERSDELVVVAYSTRVMDFNLIWWTIQRASQSLAFSWSTIDESMHSQAGIVGHLPSSANFSCINDAWSLVNVHARHNSEEHAGEHSEMNGSKANKTCRWLFTIAQYRAV